MSNNTSFILGATDLSVVVVAFLYFVYKITK